jgi:hypothetical protein
MNSGVTPIELTVMGLPDRLRMRTTPVSFTASGVKQLVMVVMVNTAKSAPGGVQVLDEQLLRPTSSETFRTT